MPDFPAQRRAEFAIKAIAPEKQCVFGWSYVAVQADGQQVIDHSGEFLPLEHSEAFEDAVYEFILKSRVGGEMHLRTCGNCNSTVGMDQWSQTGGLVCPVCAAPTLKPKQIGRVIESMVFTPEKLAAMGLPEGVLPQLAWWIGLRIDDAQTWARVKTGEYRAFSFAHVYLKEALRAAA